MLESKSLWQFFSKRLLVLLFALVLSVFVIEIASRIALQPDTVPWNAQQDEIDSTLASAIAQHFSKLLEIPTQISESLSRDSSVHKILTPHGHERRDFSSIINVFQQADKDGNLSIELFDSSNKLIAYHNRQIHFQSSNWTDSTTDIRYFLNTQPLYTYLAVKKIIRNDRLRILGVIVAAVPFEVSVPLHNRYLQSKGFRNEVENLFHVRLEGAATKESGLLHDGRYYPVPLRDPSGQTISVTYFLRSDPATYYRRITAIFTSLRSIILLLIIAFVSIPLLRWYLSSLQRLWTRVLFVTIHLWGFRYLLLFTGISSSVLPLQIQDPVLFASSFGFGIASSIGETCITSIVLLAEVFLLQLIFFSKKNAPRPTSETPRTFAFAGFIFLTFLVYPLIRGYAAIIKSFVFDSSFNFDELASIFSQPFYWLHLVNAFFITSVFFLSLLALLRAFLRYIFLCYKNLFARFTFALICSFGWYFIFYFSTTEFLYPVSLYLIIAISLPFIVFITRHNRFQQLHSASVQIALFSLVSTVIFYVTLRTFTHEKRKDNVQAAAADYQQPTDHWSSLLITQTFASIDASRATVIAALRSPIADNVQQAFHLWAASPFSHESNNSAICVLDSSNNVTSFFSIGIPPSTVKEFAAIIHRTVRDTILSLEYGGNSRGRMRKFFVGIKPIIDHTGKRIGTTFIQLIPLEKLNATQNQADILRNASPPENFAPEDDFILSRFTNDTLVSISDPEMTGSMLLAPPISQALSTSSRGVWSVLPTPVDSLDTFYLNVFDGYAKEIIAISIPNCEFRFTLYRFVRFGIIFLIGSFLLLLTMRWIHGNQSQTIFHISFTSKLLAGILFVAAIPIILFWISSRQSASEITRTMQTRQIRNALESIEANLTWHIDSAFTEETLKEKITHSVCQEIAESTGDEVNLYIGTQLHATSKPELYSTSLWESRLHEEAYVNILQEKKDFYCGTERAGDFSYLVGYKPLRDEHGNVFAIISTPTLFEQQAFIKENVRTTATIFMWSFIVLILVLVISTFLAKQIAKPIHELIGGINSITAGDLSQRIPLTRKDEFGTLISSFNEMTGQLERSQRELAAAERELAWKEMAKLVAHEIRNPLTPMKLAAQHLVQAYHDGAANIGKLIEQVSATIIEQVESLSRIASEFSHFARMPKRNLTILNLATILRDTASMFVHYKNITFEIECENLPDMYADREELQRCFTNIIRNAVQSMKDNGRIIIHAFSTMGNITITITDNGSGIDPAILPRIFEPNFSTKTEGMGLGLAIVKKIIDDLHGEIEITSVPEKGSTVVITLPLSDAQETM